MDLNLDCENIRITPSHKQVYVQLEGVDKSDVMDHFDIVEFLEHFGINDVLDYIGVDEVKKYFNLFEEDEQQ